MIQHTTALPKKENRKKERKKKKEKKTTLPIAPLPYLATLHPVNRKSVVPNEVHNQLNAT
jgi:hypothetical protein